MNRKRVERIARHDATFRNANERVARAATALTLEDEEIPFICECADVECYEIVRLRLDDYRRVRSNARWFLAAPGHEEAAGGVVEVVETRPGFVIVEKQGFADEMAEGLTSEADQE